MNEPIKKPNPISPESYSPETPKMMNILEGLSSEKVIDTFAVEGVEFTIIEKGRTFYAGAYGEIPELDWKPNTQWWGALDDGYDKEILKKPQVVSSPTASMSSKPNRHCMSASSIPMRLLH
ncbi:MAG: hypothetical protein K0S55_2170 [Clostridia bacterium]|nr:hypothetical protein [Clostridia bacterium]